MTDNRTTELLCKLLEERGVDYTRNDFGITWNYYSDPHTATESMDGTLIVTGLTPDQAIAATLGNSRAERTCEFSIKDNMNETEGMGDVWIECSACNCVFDFYADEWLMKMSYCPNCGCKVVDE